MIILIGINNIMLLMAGHETQHMKDSQNSSDKRVVMKINPKILLFTIKRTFCGVAINQRKGIRTNKQLRT